jgi:hypothetical protein
MRRARGDLRVSEASRYGAITARGRRRLLPGSRPAGSGLATGVICCSPARQASTLGGTVVAGHAHRQPLAPQSTGGSAAF